tara:strand:- start:340 stop:495 length:156 start_codon:yes stop_codon:yes gene_type:complete
MIPSEAFAEMSNSLSGATNKQEAPEDFELDVLLLNDKFKISRILTQESLIA